MGIQAIANPPTLPRTAQIWLSSLQYICSKIPWIKLVVSQYSGYLWVIIPKNPAVVFPWTRLSCDALGCQAQPPLRSAHSHLCVQLHWPTRMSHVCVKHFINHQRQGKTDDFVEKKVFSSLGSNDFWHRIQDALSPWKPNKGQMLGKKETTTASIVKHSKHDNNSMHSKHNSEE